VRKPLSKTLNNYHAVRGNTMKPSSHLFGQFSGLLGSAFAAACCLGLPLVLSAVGALGLGFIVQDAYLMPLFAAFVIFTLWQLYRSANSKTRMQPFWLGLVAAIISIVAMWFTVTGIYPLTWLIILSLVTLLGASLWDILAGRHSAQCASADEAASLLNPSRRKANGAALAIASAGVFYGLYASVEAIAPKAGENDIKCWGANSCKGKSACGSALNSCTGQNACKGKGWSFMPQKACYAKGGMQFEGSPGDPKSKS